MKSSTEPDRPLAVGDGFEGGLDGGSGSEAAGPEWVPFPVTSRLPLDLEAPERRRIGALSRRLLAREPDLRDADRWAAGVQAGFVPGAPCLHVQDVLGAAAVPGHRDLALELRGYGLARDGDLVLASRPPSRAFVELCRSRLGLGRAAAVVPAPPPRRVSLAHRCLRDPACFARVARLARRTRGLTVVPYAGTSAAWILAGAIADRSGTPVRVAAPPPLLTRRVNDKLWFIRVVEELLGPRAEPPSYRAYGLAQLTERVHELARSVPRIGIKLPRSAGALGNVVLDVARLRRRSLSEIRAVLADLLGERGWRQRFPVLVSVWERPVLVSPSVQTWIPSRGLGPPIVEGVFDQELLGPTGEFGGCHPSTLPPAVCRRLAHEAGLLAVLFQELGYFGRCSFDAILVGERPERCAVHWIESNGRWGGTSLPMTLADRLVGDWRRMPFAALHRDDPGLRPRAFEAVLDALGERLFTRERGSGIVLPSSAGLEDGKSLDVMALAPTPERARADVEDAARVLLGPA